MNLPKLLTVLSLMLPCAGCPVTQDQSVPVDAVELTEQTTGASYWRYVPEGYTADRRWPLVITLHGTRAPAYDTASRQIDEWKHLAEEKQFIVVAPRMDSVQGILPVIDSIWFEDLRDDERTILAVLEEVGRDYNIDPNCVMLTGFSSGGFPMYWTGLRNPGRFNALVARACNCRVDMLEQIELTDAARALPILIFWGKDDFQRVQDQSWEAYRYLRRRGFDRVKQEEVPGGHLRRPEMAYEFWLQYMPEAYRK